MLERGKINPGEFHMLVIFFTIGSSILVAPSLLAKAAKQDAWIASLMTIIISLSFIFLYNQLASLYPSMTLVELNKKIFGKWVGTITSLIFLFYFFYLSAALLREIGDFMTTQVLIETPIEMIMILFFFTCVLGVRMGLEVISRSALIFFPWIVGLLFMLILFLIPESKFIQLQPILGDGLKPIFNGSYHYLGLPYLELIIFLMLTPFVNDNAKMKKAFYSGTIIGGLILSILIFFCILVLGPDFTERNVYPTYILGKKISIGDVFERIEIIVAIIWFFTMYFKLTICLYGLTLGCTFPLLKTVGMINVGQVFQRLDPIALILLIIGGFFKIVVFFCASVEGFSSLFNKPNLSKITIPIMAVIVIVMAIYMADNPIEHLKIGLEIVPNILYIPLFMVIPILLAVIVMIKKKLMDKPGSN